VALPQDLVRYLLNLQEPGDLGDFVIPRTMFSEDGGRLKQQIKRHRTITLKKRDDQNTDYAALSEWCKEHKFEAAQTKLGGKFTENTPFVVSCDIDPDHGKLVHKKAGANKTKGKNQVAYAQWSCLGSSWTNRALWCLGQSAHPHGDQENAD